ncbi:MAG TPA: caspase family protein [Longimicrobiales bacterium]|nr:caspase family protein [Longimicrobiales bacterium]
MRRHNVSTYAVIPFLLVLSIASGPSAELWYVHYDRATKAIERSQWHLAIAEVEQAIEKKDDSSVRARTYGMRFIAYMPYYYAGVAHYNLGDLENARRFLELEQRQGEIQRSDRLHSQLQVLLAAAAGPSTTASAVAAAETELRERLAERMQRGIDRFENGDFEAALAEFGAVLALEPRHEDARLWEARVRSEAMAAMLARVEIETRPSIAVVTPIFAPVPVPPVAAAQPPVPAVTAPPAAADPAPTVAPVKEPPAVAVTAPPVAAVTTAPVAAAAVAPAAAAPAPAAAAPAPAVSEFGILESRAWELVRRGRGQLDAGEYESARATFDIALLLAQDLTGGGQLREEATRFRDIADGEIRRVAEARRQAELAAQRGAAQEPPRIAIVTPVNVEEPMQSEVVRLQGVVMDNNGVANLEIEVNGRRYDRVQTGTRGIQAVVRPGGGQGQQLENQGTVVNFYHDVYLTEDVNHVIVRARNITGQVTEQPLDLRLQAERSEVYAAVIGIQDYQHPGVPDLGYTVADAEAFYAYLVDDLGVPEENIIKLIDSQATTQAMKTALGNDLRRRAGAEDMVIIYYAGHGGPEVDAQNLDGDGLEKYLLSWEADPENLYGTAFSMNEIATIFGRLQAERVIFIADACYSGASGGRTVLSGRRATISDSFLDRLGASGTGRVIMSASSANEPSQERSDLGHGVFTYYLLEGLRGAADANRDGAIMFDEAYDYVARMVPEATGQTQHPVKKGEVEGNLIMGRVAI